MSTLLVVGAAPGSVGGAIAEMAEAEGHIVVTAGIQEEALPLDLVKDSMGRMHGVLSTVQPTHVVCTAGINEPETPMSDLTELYARHFAVNVTGPMRLLDAWRGLLGPMPKILGMTHHYVAISSNSARVPRSGSAPYCASKAALSMALRVKAREGAANGSRLVVYGYEPGLVKGTPMTAQTAEQWPGVPLTRMRHPALSEGLLAEDLAWMVVHNLALGAALNGVMLPFDADEA